MNLLDFSNFLRLAKEISTVSDEDKIKEFQDLKQDVEKKITKVQCSRQIFEKLPAGSMVPICLLEVTYIKGWISSEPALVFRFGTFEEQPIKTTEEQISYVKNIIDTSGYFADTYKIEHVSPGNVKTNIKNSNYGMYISVTLL
jgi:hypothetical protein